MLADNARAVRWAGPLFALFALIMVPWTVYIGESLPRPDGLATLTDSR